MSAKADVRDEHTSRMKVGEAVMAAVQKEYPDGKARLDVRQPFPVVHVFAYGHWHHIRVIPSRATERTA